jgi:hypothetical protein
MYSLCCLPCARILCACFVITTAWAPKYVADCENVFAGNQFGGLLCSLVPERTYACLEVLQCQTSILLCDHFQRAVVTVSLLLASDVMRHTSSCQQSPDDRVL